MGFSAKQVQALRRQPRPARMSGPGRRMAGNLPISRAGTPSRRPTGSSASTAGTGRLSSPNACLPARTAERSLRSTSPGCGSPCRRTAQPSFGKATAPEKATAHHRARCTTSPSRLRKPMPPNGRWRPSANPLVLSSIGRQGHNIPEAPARTVLATHYRARPPRAGRRPGRVPPR